MEADKRPTPPEADRSIPELLKKLAAETTLLVRQELQLARAELLQAAQRLSGSAVAFALGVIFALAAFGALTATLIIALALAMPLWASALIVTVVYAVVAAVAVQRGLANVKKAQSPVLKQTLETLHEDVETVQAGVRRGR